MKVVCVNNKIGNSENFKLNVVYESIDYTSDVHVFSAFDEKFPDDYILVKWNDGIDVWCKSKCFMTLEDWRQSRLNKLKI